jgi:ribonuclease R
MPETDEPRPKHFQDVLKKAAGKREEYLLTTLALRSMSLARYEAEAKGHFGLALDHYTHFTSPIRRYPDLIVHRALKRRLSGEPLSADDATELRSELGEAATHCSERERNAESAERKLVEWKKAAFMRDFVGDVFDARVTGIAERGIFVLLLDHHVEGFVPFPRLRRDWYDRDERGVRLVGRDTGRVLRLGDELRVRVESVDVFRRRIEMSEA